MRIVDLLEKARPDIEWKICVKAHNHFLMEYVIFADNKYVITIMDSMTPELWVEKILARLDDNEPFI